MGIRKALISIYLCSTLLCQSCGEGGSDTGTVQDAQSEEILEYRAKLRQITKDLFYQDSVLSLIQGKLDSVDRVYVTFMGSVEENRIEEDQADIIINKINRLTALIEKAKQEISGSSVSNKGIIELIERFKVELENKEHKIDSLRTQLVRKDSTIQTNSKEINELRQSNWEKELEISSLELELRSIKAKAYFDVGNVLLNIASDMPEVKGLFSSKSKKEVKEMQKSLFFKAKECFGLALYYGYSQAKYKINEIDRLVEDQGG
jgi:chromosome segregation ATPase